MSHHTLSTWKYPDQLAFGSLTPSSASTCSAPTPPHNGPFTPETEEPEYVPALLGSASISASLNHHPITQEEQEALDSLHGKQRDDEQEHGAEFKCFVSTATLCQDEDTDEEDDASDETETWSISSDSSEESLDMTTENTPPPPGSRAAMEEATYLSLEEMQILMDLDKEASNRPVRPQYKPPESIAEIVGAQRAKAYRRAAAAARKKGDKVPGRWAPY